MNIKDIEEIINDLEVEYPTNDNFKIIYDYIKKVEKENKKLKQERDKYKSVIDKIREYTGNKLFDDYMYYSYEDLKQNIEEILKELEEGNSNEN